MELCIQLHAAIDGDPEALGALVERFGPWLRLQLDYRGVPAAGQDARLVALFTSDLARLMGLATDDRKAHERILRFLGRVQLLRLLDEQAHGGLELAGELPELDELEAPPDWERQPASDAALSAVRSALQRTSVLEPGATELDPAGVVRQLVERW